MSETTEVLTGTEETTNDSWDLDFDPADFEETTEGSAAEETETGTDEGMPETTEEPAAEAAGEEKAPAAAEEPKYKVKFRGEEQELPVSQLVTLAQKGMNYDHLLEQNKQLAVGQKGVDLLTRYARGAGMEFDAFVSYLEKNLQQQEVQKLMDERGIDEATAAEIIGLRADKAAKEEKTAEQKKQEEMRSDLLALLEVYPDVRQLPPEVVEMTRTGMKPLTAYAIWDAQQARKAEREAQTKIDAKERAEENRKKAVGSARGSEKTKDRDLFDMGFDSVF